MVTIPISINGNLFHVKLSFTKVREGCRISVNHVEMFIRYQDQHHGHKNDLYNYVINYLQWYFVILQLQDTIHEGDITRTNIILKTMIPFSYSHSAMSKYFIECIDYILKTEITVPPDDALRVRAASFVNVHGGEGKNKAADMDKGKTTERLVKKFRGKQENSKVAISKPAPVI